MNKKEVESDFKQYQKCVLSDIGLEFNLTKTEFEPQENSLYIPLIGTQSVIEDLHLSKIKNQNMCQVVLDKDKVNTAYLRFYLNSESGKKYWFEALNKKRGVIKRLNKQDIKDLKISLPSFERQREIAEVSIKMESAISAFNSIKNSLALHPISSGKERKKLDSIINAISEVSPLLCEESITHELKSSFRTPYPSYPEPFVDEKGQQQYLIMDGKKKLFFKSKKQIHDHLESIIMKTIASFLNTRGGTLVIGVHERDNNKTIVGIDREGFTSNDDYQRTIIQKIQNTFGSVILSKYISIKIIEIDGEFVCVVTCDPYRQLEGDVVYLDEKVYARTGPRVDQLTTREVLLLLKK
ncbi:MAG: hypothetical protein CMM53_07090 [Rhodospirillaceae bacterium]|nr:hypothetical protein [Rhodospirillaceae bacterium]|tara:strand:- start:424 stop:1482 length:1059 start_codon:yes stop_codon:yes gene_type:complete